MKNNVSIEIEQRLIRFSVDVIHLAERHKAALPFSVIDQVIRSSGSIGANYAEAQNASSRTDFRNKIYIAKKEAAESRYWLQVVSKLVEDEVVMTLLKEVHEILLILQKIVNTLREKSAT
jgi:four helix bundle protein